MPVGRFGDKVSPAPTLGPHCTLNAGVVIGIEGKGVTQSASGAVGGVTSPLCLLSGAAAADQHSDVCCRHLYMDSPADLKVRGSTPGSALPGVAFAQYDTCSCLCT